MNPVNSSYDEKTIMEAIESSLADFYNSLIKNIDKLSIEKVMKKKNPYLYRAKYIQKTAADIVSAILAAYVSSSEETIFGNCFFEPLAIAASGGNKSLSEGIDLEIHDKQTNRVFSIAIKSGPAVFNAASKKRQEENFNRAKRIVTQGKMGYEPIIAYAYGRKQQQETKAYTELAGQDFWEFITGDPQFYKKIMHFIGQLPETYVQKFNDSYKRAFHRLLKDFLNKFCDEQGAIDWEKIVEYNSGNIKHSD